MTDSSIIFKFLSREFTDDNGVIYLYVCCTPRCQKMAIDTAMKYIKPLFCPELEESFVKSILIDFLETKKEQYNNGLITLKPLF